MPRHFGAISHRVNIRRVGPQESVGNDTAVHVNPGVTRQPRAGPHAHSAEHCIGFDRGPIIERHSVTLARAIHLGGQRTKVEGRAFFFQCRLHRSPGPLRQERGQAPAHRVYRFNRETAIEQVISKLTANKPRTNNGDFLGASRREQLLKTSVVIKIVDAKYILRRVTGDGWSYQFSPQSQDQLAVGHCFAVFKLHHLLLRVDACHTGAGTHRHV